MIPENALEEMTKNLDMSAVLAEINHADREGVKMMWVPVAVFGGVLLRYTWNMLHGTRLGNEWTAWDSCLQVSIVISSITGKQKGAVDEEVCTLTKHEHVVEGSCWVEEFSCVEYVHATLVWDVTCAPDWGEGN